jgi:hypothetical protein
LIQFARIFRIKKKNSEKKEGKGKKESKF